MHVLTERGALDSSGNKVTYEIGLGCKLAANTTYLFDVSMGDEPTESVHCMWDANLVATVSFEDSNAPAFKGAAGAVYTSTNPVDISAYDTTTAGAWVHEDPSTAYIPAGTGYTVTNMTVAIAGGTANGTIWNLGNMGTRRGRMKVVVTTTGGYFRCMPHGKSA